MESQRCALLLCLLISVCMGEFQKCSKHHCPTTKKTTTHSTTTHTSKTTTHQITTTHSNHTTTHQITTPLTNHTTTHQITTPHTNHTTTQQITTSHTNYTTTHQNTTPYTNHTTTHQITTFHTNHTTAPSNTTIHQNTTHTIHTTIPTNITLETTTPHTNYTTIHHTKTPFTNSTTHQTRVPITNYTTHHTSFHPNYTTQNPTTLPPSSDFFVNGTSGTCLRITAALEIIFNDTKGKELPPILIPPPPATTVSGNCSTDIAKMTLRFPGGRLSFIFKKSVGDSHFYLDEVSVQLYKGNELHANSTLHIMDTPLGRSFSCKRVEIEMTSSLKILATGVRAQAFKLHDGEYGTAVHCSSDSNNMTVPIVVGIILIVLVLIVVLAYVFARHRSHSGYQTL